MDNPFFPGGSPPFGGPSGCADGFCDEIFAYGFRNPFRISFDRATGDLYGADVGQRDIEEVNVIEAGGNYGWRVKEGSFCFDPNGTSPGFVTAGECGSDELIDPIAEYDHDEGLAMVGGFVYRGRRNGLGLRLLGFGQDANGALYVLGNRTGAPVGDTGVVLRVEPR